jgi:hypothetical protein
MSFNPLSVMALRDAAPDVPRGPRDLLLDPADPEWAPAGERGSTACARSPTMTPRAPASSATSGRPGPARAWPSSSATGAGPVLDDPVARGRGGAPGVADNVTFEGYLA